MTGQATIGLIGVGSIAAAIVEGLCAVDDPPTVVLSPRGAQRSLDLADRHDNVTRLASNQAVVDAADVIVLSVLPDQLGDVLEEIEVPAGRTVISAVASGWPIAALRMRLGADVDIVRCIPLPSVRERSGTTPMHPDHPVARTLFESLGAALVVDDEAALAAITAASSTVATSLRMLSTVADWLATRGIDAALADRFMRDLTVGWAAELAATGDDIETVRAGHETPGGLNHRIRTAWFDDDQRARLREVLDAVHERAQSST